jgi:hypothetical protein
MARHEGEREDMLAETTALRRRAEFRMSGFDGPVVAGFRDAGGCSVFFGQDPCYHFDAAGRMRRAFVGGRLYRTQGATLAELTRVRSATATELHRRDLDPSELARFLRRMRDELAELHATLKSGTIEALRQVPAGDDLKGELMEWLPRAIDAEPALAEPYAGRK